MKSGNNLAELAGTLRYQPSNAGGQGYEQSKTPNHQLYFQTNGSDVPYASPRPETMEGNLSFALVSVGTWLDL
jgi:hypothetical protein